VGRDVIKMSLRTKDPAEAKVRHAKKLQALEDEWSYHRAEVQTLSYKQVVALTKQRYDFFADRFGDNPPSTASTQNELEMRIGVDQDITRLEVWYGRAADRILKAHSIQVDAPTRKALLREIHRTDIQALELIERNADGDFSPDPKANRFPAWALPAAPPEAAPSAVSLTQLCGLWEREHLANNGAAKTIPDFRQKLASLITFLKHEDANKVTQRDISNWCDFLKHDKKLAGKTIRDKYLAAVRIIMRVGINKQHIRTDPTKDIVVKVTKPQKLRPKGYTDAEALSILHQARQPFPSDGRVASGNKRVIRWLPWICAFTGARGGEVAQLRKEDLIEQDGILCIRITPLAGSVKTSNYRLVPVHPQLIEEGLTEFIRESPAGHLFFELGKTDDPQTKAASAYKEVGKWIRKTVGNTADIQPNHAWRHRFKTISRDCGIGSEYSEAIMGHEDGKASTSYGEISPKALYREIIKLPHIAVE
jgi:integrase